MGLQDVFSSLSLHGHPVNNALHALQAWPKERGNFGLSPSKRNGHLEVYLRYSTSMWFYRQTSRTRTLFPENATLSQMYLLVHLETADRVPSGGPQREDLVVPPALDRLQLCPENGGVADGLANFHPGGLHRLLPGAELPLVPSKKEAYLR